MRKKKPKASPEEIQQKAEELNNSRPLDVWRTSNHPEVKEVVSILFEEMKTQGLVSTRYAEKHRKNLSAVVLDLYVAYLSDPTMYIGYSRDRSKYSKGSRYKALFLSYELIIKSIDFLISNQYVENTHGYRHPDAPFKSRSSRMKATEKLIDLFKQKKVAPRMMKRDEEEPLIILRDEAGNSIEYEETEETKRMTENLKSINKALEKFAILLYVTDEELKKLNERMAKDPEKGPIDFTNKKLKRIFNNSSFQQGGRFYGGWWQNVPRELRKYIRMDGKHVVECDYSGLHINMLYAMENLPMPEGDVYELDGYSNDVTFRRFVKQMLLVMVNSEKSKGHKWETARKAIHSAVHRTKELDLPPEITSTTGKSLFPVMDAFEKKHEPIKHYLCTGIGIDLQNIDSQMAEKVLLHMTKQYAVLPLHDSFIIHHGFVGHLLDAMEQAFFETFGCKSKVDLKYDSADEWRREHPPKQGHFEVNFAKVRAAEAPYSTYHTLLREHWKSQSPPGEKPAANSDVPW
jgi:hypothetical protein